MSTLYTQPPRDWFRVTEDDLSDFVARAAEIAAEQKVSVCDVIAAARVLEMRRANHLYIANGNAFDEQLAGLGTEMRAIADALDT